MVSKRNFPQKDNRNQLQHHMFRRKNQKTNSLYIKDYNKMFDVIQMPDNPGYVDFTLPTPNSSAERECDNQRNTNLTMAKTTHSVIPNKQKQPNAFWGRNSNTIVDDGNRFALKVMSSEKLVRELGDRKIQMLEPIIQPRHRTGPIGISTFLPPPLPHGFQPPILLPAHRAGPPTRLISTHPSLFPHRSLPPVIPCNALPPIRPPKKFYSTGGIVSKLNKGQTTKHIVKGKSIIKTLKTLMSEYPIHKPWVTPEIRMEYNKKVDIENSLKGHKDDELFAKFKIQRDKFVAMYEAARYEYLKEEAAAVKAKLR